MQHSAREHALFLAKKAGTFLMGHVGLEDRRVCRV